MLNDGLGETVGTGRDNEDVPATAIQTALAIEPDLRLIEGLVTALILLGERTDPIAPGAIAAIAQSAHQPISRLINLRRAITTAKPRSECPSQTPGTSITDKNQH